MALDQAESDLLENLLDKLAADSFLDFIESFKVPSREYFFCNPRDSARSKDENSDKFEEGEEHKLEYFEIHQNYVRLFESKIEAHLKDNGTVFICKFCLRLFKNIHVAHVTGVNMKAFISLCQKASAPDSVYRILIESVAEVEDYNAFVSMMRFWKNADEEE